MHINCKYNYLFSFRLAEDISEICQFIIMAGFLWTLINIANCLMLLNFDLVEYIYVYMNVRLFFSSYAFHIL